MNAIVLERVLVTQSPRYPRVAETLKDLRVKAGLTQEDVAHEVGLTLSGYRGYEQGKRDLKSEQIETFARVFKAPVSAITSRLWPDDVQIVKTRLSHNWDELQRQIDGWPPELQEQAIRAWIDSAAVTNNASELARRN